MNFQVPQFIEVEDKIIGPLTFKQFFYIAGGLGIGFILWVYLPHFLAILIGAPIVIFGLALSFYKINNRPFINIVESAFYYITSSKLYIWKHRDKVPTPTKEADVLMSKNIAGMPVPKLSQSKLKDLSWSLDVQEKIR